jgi:NDP-sugar pyrophosphorylase family protein
MKNCIDYVVLCGGQGKRIRPITNFIPKSLVPICGKPFIDYQVEWMLENNAGRMVFVGHEKVDQIQAHLKKRYWNIYDKKLFAINETYWGSRHQAGTLRALFAGLKRLGQRHTSEDADAVAVTYGDSYLYNLDAQKMLDVFLSLPTPKEVPLMAVMETMPSEKYSPNYSMGRERKILPLMADGCTRVIDYGIALYNKYTICEDAEKVLNLGLSDYKDLIKTFSNKRAMSTYMVDEKDPFFEIGSFHGIANLTAAMMKGKYDRYLCPRLFL